jgi:DNA-binding response OmpR family regulator
MKVLLVEDDRNLSQSLCAYLVQELYEMSAAYSYQEALQKNHRDFDLIILDWNLGDGMGLDLLLGWKQSGLQTPTIFLTAKADVADKVLSLESGASDYLTKPFEARELLARMRVQLRSSKPFSPVISVGPLRMETTNRKIMFHENEIVLSKTEYDLLFFLVQSPNKVFSREELLKEVWGYQSSPTTRTVDTHILQLRQKLAAELFETVHGIGYRLKAGK